MTLAIAHLERSLGIDQRGAECPVAEGDLRGFGPVALPHLRGERVAELVGLPSASVRHG